MPRDMIMVQLLKSDCEAYSLYTEAFPVVYAHMNAKDM